MTTGEIIRLLRAEGLTIYAQKLHYMIRKGYVDRPPQLAGRLFLFEAKHVAQIRDYLKNPPRRGVKPRGGKEGADGG